MFAGVGVMVMSYGVLFVVLVSLTIFSLVLGTLSICRHRRWLRRSKKGILYKSVMNRMKDSSDP